MPDYMMDCFYRDHEGRLDRVSHESRPLLAHEERGAISEAERVAISAKAAYFEIRLTARMEARIIYVSNVKGRAEPRSA
jgi:hypothetical protein